MRRITSSAKDAITTMINRVKDKRLADFEEEDVTKATGQIKMEIKRLGILNKVPNDIEKSIHDILQNSWVSDYTLFFSQLQIN